RGRSHRLAENPAFGTSSSCPGRCHPGDTDFIRVEEDSLDYLSIMARIDYGMKPAAFRAPPDISAMLPFTKS
ncbi:MAG TPA: hypothetical protein PKW32_06140, partial [Verrucomicrobiota bacterium]|nr:hypothetical protein [Verrucomicrobiota bacterium]